MLTTQSASGNSLVPAAGRRWRRWRTGGAALLSSTLALTLLPLVTSPAAATDPEPPPAPAPGAVAPWPRPETMTLTPVEDTLVVHPDADADVWPNDEYAPNPARISQDEVAGLEYLTVNTGEISWCDEMEPVYPSYSLLKFELPDPADLPPGAVISGVQLRLTTRDTQIQGTDGKAYVFTVDPDFDTTMIEWDDDPPSWDDLVGLDETDVGQAAWHDSDSPLACTLLGQHEFPRNGWGLGSQGWNNTGGWGPSTQSRDAASRRFLQAVHDAMDRDDRWLALKLWAPPGAEMMRYYSSERSPSSGPRLDLSFATPELVQAVPTDGGASLLVTGGVIGAPYREYRFEISGSDTCTSAGLGDLTPLGRIAVTTDGAGLASVSHELYLDGAAMPDFVTAALRVNDAEYYYEGLLAELSAPTECVPVGADNDIWPRALTVTPTTGDFGPASVDPATVTATVDGFLERPGKARWYKVPVTPEGRLQVDLTDLPADYDVAIFGDIAEAYEHLAGLSDVEDLKRLSAQYAPSVFSPSVFSPSVFSPSVFSPDAFAPSVFSPSVFSPSVFSPSVFSPSVFSPSVFSPSVFSPSVFSPSVFSPSVFSPSEFTLDPDLPPAVNAEAFSGAQSRSILAVSATPGTVNESAVASTWGADSYYYVRVTGNNGAHDVTSPFTLDLTRNDLPACVGVSPIDGTETAPANGATTLVLRDSARPLEGTGDEHTAMMEALNEFVSASAPGVNGVVANLNDSTRIRALRTQADAHKDCVYATNLVASATKELVDAYRVANPGLKYIVILGPDGSVPFFRYPDQALLGPESDYSPPVADNTISQASLRLNYFLGQDEYGSADVIDVGAYRIPLPDLAVGRVVETAAEVTGILENYLAESTVEPTSSLVTGYDFLAETAASISDDLEASTGIQPTELITANNLSPQHEDAWTAPDLEDALYTQRNDLVFLGGHFSANSALAADFETSIFSRDLADEDIATADFTNTIVFSIGCHAGYNIDNADRIRGVTWELDWAQAFAQRGATLIAGTGYQYGDTDFMEYSERIYADFAKELRYGTGAVAIGDALMAAKANYLVQTPDPRGLHRKSLMQIAIFGLPMLAVDLPQGRLDRPSTTSAVATTTDYLADPGDALDLQSADLSLSPQLQSHTVGLTGIGTDPDTSIVTANYLSFVKSDPPSDEPSENQLTPEVLANPYEPVIPLLSRDVTVNGKVLRGVGFRGGDYSDTDIVPLTGAPTTEIRGVHTAFSSPVFYPMRLATVNHTASLGAGGKTYLLVTPAQHKAASGFQSTQRSYQSLGLRLFYSSAIGRAGQAAAPSLSEITAVIDGDDILFGATAITDPAAGIQEVWVTYTGHANRWASLDLVQCNLVDGSPPPDCRGDASSSRWVGRLIDGAASASALQFIVQAAGGNGLVGMSDNLGAYHEVERAISGPVPPAPAATTLALSGVPDSAEYGATASVTATLASADGPVAGKTVTAHLGGSSRQGVTNATGQATFAMPVTALPGATELRVGFAGDSGHAATSASSTVTVEKAPTTLALRIIEADDGSTDGVAVTLTSTTGPLPARSVLITLPDGSVQQVTTNYLGEASLTGVDLPASGVVLATFLGAAGDAPAMEDPSYTGSTTQLTVPAEVVKRNIAIYAGGPGCKATLGNNAMVTGGVHSEGALVVGNNGKHAGGEAVTYVKSASVKGKNWSPVKVAGTSPPAYPLSVDLAALASSADHTHSGNLTVRNNATMATGVHYVTGNVKLGNNVRGTVTIVATGTITVGNNAKLTGHLDGLSLVSAAGADRCAPVVVVGNNATIGVAFAPHGGVDIKNNARADALIGYGVTVGNNARVDGHEFP